MFLPIATDRPRTRPTLVTYALIAINCAIFLVQSALFASSPDTAEAMVNLLKLSPLDSGSPLYPWGFVTYQFVHGGLMHLLGNMLFLFVFGPPVEDRLTRVGFLFFYLIGGVIAGAAHIIFDMHPVIGASGAVAAVTGAFLVLFPRTHIRILLFFFIIGVYSIPSWWFIAFAIAKDLVYQGFGSQGVAHLAHLAGYAFGAAIPLVLLWRRFIPREPYDLLTIGRQAKRRRDFKELTRKSTTPWSAPASAPPSQQKKSIRASMLDKQKTQLREQIAECISDSRIPEAAAAYIQLLSIAPDAALPRDDHIRLANHLFQDADHTNAASAYQAFITRYPNDREAAHITLMLALISSRYLNDPIRARQLIDTLDADALPADQAKLRETLRAETA